MPILSELCATTLDLQERNHTPAAAAEVSVLAYLATGTIPGGVPPSAVRRGVTVLLQTLGPYVVQHLPAATSQLPPEHIRDSTDAEIRSSAHVSTHTLSHIGTS